MPVTERKVGIFDVGVFSLINVAVGDTIEDYIGDLKTATLTMETETEEGRAVDDVWAYPIATNCKWKIDGSQYTYNTYFKNIKLLACCNNEILDEFSKFHNNIFKLSQLVDDDIFYRTRSNYVSKNVDEKFIVGWSGDQTNPYKNTDFIIRACKEAKVKLSIVNNFKQEKLNKWYNAIDAIVCASTDEGGPNMILEAGACGIPIISTPTGLVPEIINNKINGIIVPSNRLDLMIQNIKELSNNIELRETISKNIEKDILNGWTYKTKLYEIKEVLQKLIS
jgi:glycosyltransferase involved in cell wall biosynthesis